MTSITPVLQIVRNVRLYLKKCLLRSVRAAISSRRSTPTSAEVIVTSVILFMRISDSESVNYTAGSLPIRSVMSVQEDYPTLSVPNHRHNDLEFSYVTKENMKYSVNGEIIELNEGDMIFVNSAQLHYGFWEKKEQCEFLCVLFGLELLSAVPDSVISKLIGNGSPSYIIFRISDIEDKTVIDRLTKLNTICEQQKDGYDCCEYVS